jgi:hypothetical protein
MYSSEYVLVEVINVDLVEVDAHGLVGGLLVVC